MATCTKITTVFFQKNVTPPFHIERATFAGKYNILRYAT